MNTGYTRAVTTSAVFAAFLAAAIGLSGCASSSMSDEDFCAAVIEYQTLAATGVEVGLDEDGEIETSQEESARQIELRELLSSSAPETIRDAVRESLSAGGEGISSADSAAVLSYVAAHCS